MFTPTNRTFNTVVFFSLSICNCRKVMLVSEGFRLSFINIYPTKSDPDLVECDGLLVTIIERNDHCILFDACFLILLAGVANCFEQ